MSNDNKNPHEYAVYRACFGRLWYGAGTYSKWGHEMSMTTAEVGELYLEQKTLSKKIGETQHHIQTMGRTIREIGSLLAADPSQVSITGGPHEFMSNRKTPKSINWLDIPTREELGQLLLDHQKSLIRSAEIKDKLDHNT